MMSMIMEDEDREVERERERERDYLQLIGQVMSCPQISHKAMYSIIFFFYLLYLTSNWSGTFFCYTQTHYLISSITNKQNMSLGFEFRFLFVYLNIVPSKRSFHTDVLFTFFFHSSKHIPLNSPINRWPMGQLQSMGDISLAKHSALVMVTVITGLCASLSSLLFPHSFLLFSHSLFPPHRPIAVSPLPCPSSSELQ